MEKYEELLTYIEEERVRFIRLTFFDIFGVQKNIAITPGELRRALRDGIAFDASAVAGFSESWRSDLFLEPDISTLALIPWRSGDGGVIRMICDITRPDGSPFERDGRCILKQAIREADALGVHVDFGAEVEFYLFLQDEAGRPTREPQDQAGYFDVFPADCGENFRRDVCNTLLDIGITPEASHHEQGPGQNEIDFRYGDPLVTADNISTFKWVVENVAAMHGYAADFGPKPLPDRPGSGMHLNISVSSETGMDLMMPFMAGVMEHIREITLFLNPLPESYMRLGRMEAPAYISWSEQNRSQLIRIPAVRSGGRRFELRSPDPAANPYLAHALLIHAGLDGIRRGLDPGEPLDLDLFAADQKVREQIERLPATHAEAVDCALGSGFLEKVLPAGYLEAYCGK